MIETSPTYGIGKLLPQAVDVEEAILGAIMLERDAYSAVAPILSAEAFYKDAHRDIFRAMGTLSAGNVGIDLLTVTDTLRKASKLEICGGAYYISDLTNRVSSAANLIYHARILKQKHILRELIETCTRIQREAYDENVDCFDLLDQAKKEIYDIADIKGREAWHIYDVVQRVLDDAYKTMSPPKGSAYVGTGFTAIDAILGGLYGGDVTVIAARPGMGKSAFMTAIAKNSAIKYQKPAAIFSLEMTDTQLVIRLVAPEYGLSVNDFRQGNITPDQLDNMYKNSGWMAKMNIYIDDEPGINLLTLSSKIRRLKKQYGIELVIIDYLQLMGSTNKSGERRAGASFSNREAEVSAISRGIKGIAKEHNIPIVELAQLSRAVESRTNKRPVLSDLRESGSIEQDADQVLFIYRPEYYGIDKDENGHFLPEGYTEIIIAKNRHGACDTVPLIFKPKSMEFTDMYGDAPVPLKRIAPYNPGRDMDDDEKPPY